MSEHLLFPQEPEGNGFLEDACVVYGEDGAAIICGMIIHSLRGIQLNLPPSNPPDIRLRLAVMNPPGRHDRSQAVHAWAYSPENEIALMINPDSELTEITNMLSQAVRHEYGHLIHHQYNPDFGHESAAAERYSSFMSVICEGIARSAEAYRNPSANESARSFYMNRPGITEGLHLLLDTEATAAMDKYDMLYGNIDGLEDVYAIGHYVVSCLALASKRDFLELAQTSLLEYVEFAQTELV